MRNPGLRPVGDDATSMASMRSHTSFARAARGSSAVEDETPDEDAHGAVPASRRQSASSARDRPSGAAQSASSEATRTDARDASGNDAPPPSFGSAVQKALRRRFLAKVPAASLLADGAVPSDATRRSAMHSPGASLADAASSLAAAASRVAASKLATSSSAAPSFSALGALVAESEIIGLDGTLGASVVATTLVASTRAIDIGVSGGWIRAVRRASCR